MIGLWDGEGVSESEVSRLGGRWKWGEVSFLWGCLGKNKPRDPREDIEWKKCADLMGRVRSLILIWLNGSQGSNNSGTHLLCYLCVKIKVCVCVGCPKPEWNLNEKYEVQWMKDDLGRNLKAKLWNPQCKDEMLLKETRLIWLTYWPQVCPGRGISSRGRIQVRVTWIHHSTPRKAWAKASESPPHRQPVTGWVGEGQRGKSVQKKMCGVNGQLPMWAGD